jgi:hypothetical protein
LYGIHESFAAPAGSLAARSPNTKAQAAKAQWEYLFRSLNYGCTEW